MQTALDGLAMQNKGDIQSLQRLIPEEAYRHNFIGLAQRLAPDGEDIKTVGFTTATRSLALATPRRTPVEQTQLKAKALPRTRRGIPVEIHGLLLEADAKKQAEGIIQVIQPNRGLYKIHVPRGMMSDIVKPMFEEEVVVFAAQRDNEYYFDSIDLAGRPPNTP